MNNPLQRYFRQPKIYIRLPSQGVFYNGDTVDNATGEIPVMSMTGMDELLLKTPDALMNGDATVRVIQSCVPNIKNAWEICNLDLDQLLVAIRIATYGTTMSIGHTCPNCGSDNDYNVDLMNLINHFNSCKYDNKVVIDDLTIFIRPLDYKKMTEFNIKNFELQRQLRQILDLEDEDAKNKMISELYEKLAVIQNESYIESIESVQAPLGVVNEREYITEWIINSEKSMFDSITSQIETNNQTWRVPNMDVKCEACEHESAVAIQMDQSNFFVGA
jgi:hypothetical protein